MSGMARTYANVAALADDERLARVARAQLEAAAAAETRNSMPLQDASIRVIEGVEHHWTGGRWVPWQEPEPTQVGSKLRDAAVDPLPGDIGPFVLDPSNPSRHPHGTNIVNAEVDSPLYQARVDAIRAARGEQR